MLSTLFDWVLQHRSELERLGAISLLVFVVTLIGLPLVVIFLPEDHFVRPRRTSSTRRQRHPLVWFGVTAGKNILGVVFILAGLAMLVLPGQGLLAILIGLTLMNFPGKYRIQRRFVRQGAVRGTLDKIRTMAGKPPLRL